MPNFKLIGGPSDGALVRVDVEPYPERLVINRRTMPDTSSCLDDIDEERAIYVLHHLGEQPCYASEELDEGQIVQKLLSR